METHPQSTNARARGAFPRWSFKLAAAALVWSLLALTEALSGLDRTARAQVGEGDPGSAAEYNGFDVRRSLLPLEEILRGGPPRDGIPAIDRPRFVESASSGLARDDRVLALEIAGIARAYPVRILNWHEVVNDRVAGTPVVVTYCPLCGSGVAFSSRVEGRELSFGVSGLLYNSDVLLYDRETGSLWSQLKAQAVTGPMIGKRLTMLALEHTTWEDWRARHPRTQALSFDTGFVRDYSRDPYAGYDRRPETLFPVSGRDRRIEPKAWVVGVTIGGRSKAYPFAELARTSGVVEDTLGGTRITVRYDAVHRSARILDARGRELPSVTAFWFAWAAFNPSTALFEAHRARR